MQAFNYSDPPQWNLLLGSFRNPLRFEGEVGFEGAAPSRRVAMLLGVDVDRASTAPSVKGPQGKPAPVPALQRA